MNKLVICVNAEGVGHLVVGKIYTVADESPTRYMINVFENMEDYAAMYGSYGKERFEISN